MNWLDAIVVITWIVLFILGVKNGIVKLIFSLIGLILGVVLASRTKNLLAELLFSANSTGANIASFLIILIVIMIIVMIGAWMVRSAISFIKLGWLDKLGGGILAFLIGAIFWGAIFAIIIRFPIAGLDKVISDSTLALFLLKKFPIVLGLLPEEFGAVRDFFINS